MPFWPTLGQFKGKLGKFGTKLRQNWRRQGQNWFNDGNVCQRPRFKRSQTLTLGHIQQIGYLSTIQSIALIFWTTKGSVLQVGGTQLYYLPLRSLALPSPFYSSSAGRRELRQLGSTLYSMLRDSHSNISGVLPTTTAMNYVTHFQVSWYKPDEVLGSHFEWVCATLVQKFPYNKPPQVGLLIFVPVKVMNEFRVFNIFFGILKPFLNERIRDNIIFHRLVGYIQTCSRSIGTYQCLQFPGLPTLRLCTGPSPTRAWVRLMSRFYIKLNLVLRSMVVVVYESLFCSVW